MSFPQSLSLPIATAAALLALLMTASDAAAQDDPSGRLSRRIR